MRYLDTSSLRKLGGGLERVEAHERTTLKTSALAMVELLNGIEKDDKSFGRRAAPIRAVMKCGLEIDWTFPEGKMASSFDLKMSDDRVEPLKQIVSAVVSASSLEEFLISSRSLVGRYNLQFFSEYDDTFAQGLGEVTATGNAAIRKAFEDAKAGAAQSSFEPSMLAGSFQEFCSRFLDEYAGVNDSATVLGLAGLMASLTYDQPTEAQVSQLYSKFDHSLVAFVRATSRAMMILHGGMATPGRNDGLDLAHLLYLSDEDTLMTEDAKLSSVAKASGVEVASATALPVAPRP